MEKGIIYFPLVYYYVKIFLPDKSTFNQFIHKAL
jgi:hypothetical protein